jgi:hypothetical protein
MKFQWVLKNDETGEIIMSIGGPFEIDENKLFRELNEMYVGDKLFKKPKVMLAEEKGGEEN